VGEHTAAELPDATQEADRPSSPLHHMNRNRTRSWALAGIGAGVVIVIFILVGLLSNSHTAPPPASLPSVLPSILPDTPQVDVGLIAKHEIAAVVTVDGVQAFNGVLRAQEGRTFQAVRTISVSFPKGGVVTVRVNGTDLGAPGSLDQPFSATYYPPVPSPSPTASLSPAVGPSTPARVSPSPSVGATP
jgi:hypothetical protein